MTFATLPPFPYHPEILRREGEKREETGRELAELVKAKSLRCLHLLRQPSPPCLSRFHGRDAKGGRVPWYRQFDVIFNTAHVGVVIAD